MIDLQDRMLFAIPKKGRLYERSLEFLQKIDLKYYRKERLDIALCNNFPIALIFLPAKDIPLYVGQGRVDLGITGQDMVAETQAQVKEVLNLEFGRCRLCLQAPKSNYFKLHDLVGKRIVTSFPHLSRCFFQELDPQQTTSIVTVSGSVEASCSLGLADGVVDLVESGQTSEAAGLEIIAEIMLSEAVVIANYHTKHTNLVQTIVQRLSGIITAKKYTMIEYNILRAFLKQAEQITPGRKSPTISAMEDSDWIAVKAMILKSEANNLIDQLSAIQATDILVYNIDNCRV